jgi:hypothetical protein
VINVLRQLFFKKAHEPPVVFHWFPFVVEEVVWVHAIADGASNKGEPVEDHGGLMGFLEEENPIANLGVKCWQYGDIFTFVLLGKKTTVYLGTKGRTKVKMSPYCQHLTPKLAIGFFWGPNTYMRSTYPLLEAPSAMAWTHTTSSTRPAQRYVDRIYVFGPFLKKSWRSTLITTDSTINDSAPTLAKV